MLGLQQSELSIVFIGDPAMRRLNASYRGIDKTTDVLSFPLHETFPPEGSPLGDVVVSVPKALAQSSEFGVPFYEELLRLLIHGILHLAGYDHEQGAYEKRRMQKKERELINALAPVA